MKANNKEEFNELKRINEGINKLKHSSIIREYGDVSDLHAEMKRKGLIYLEISSHEYNVGITRPGEFFLSSYGPFIRNLKPEIIKELEESEVYNMRVDDKQLVEQERDK